MGKFENEIITVDKLRERTSDQLRERIAHAFKKRQIIIRSDSMLTRETEKLREILEGYEGSDIIRSNPWSWEQKPNRVWVAHSHEYLELLTLCIEELRLHDLFLDDKIIDLIEPIIRHENQHHIPALDMGIKIYFYIDFIQVVNRDGSDSETGLKPGVYYEGSFPYWLYKEILAAPDDLSPDDKERLAFNQ